MNGARSLFVAEHLYGAFDFAPMAEVDDVTQAPAAIGAQCRLLPGIFTKMGHEVGRFRERHPVGY